MALDVYVMPLWRFKMGDFQSPIEKTLGVKPTIFALETGQISQPAVPSPPSIWKRFAVALGLSEPELDLSVRPEDLARDAKWQVRRLKKEVSQLSGIPIDWLDDGDIHYGEQFHNAPIIRAFAAWHDHRDTLPAFQGAPERDYHKHPVWSLPKPSAHRFPVLVKHSLHTGYLLPVPFAGVYEVEPFRVMNKFTFHHSIASTVSVLDELQGLLESLSAMPPECGDSGQPLQEVRSYATELQRICCLSRDHGLPVIFYG